MKQVFLEDKDLAELKTALVDFVKRVASKDGTKTPEEVEVLPGIVQKLLELFA